MTPSPDDRRHQLAHGLDAVHARIDHACRAVGRSNDVTLVVVTKTYPATDVIALSALGVRDVGENRDQEAAAKRLGWAEGVDVSTSSETRWHMIGQLQTNKVRSVVRWADVVHSVDRRALVEALDQQTQVAERDRSLEVLVQVSLDQASQGRAGAPPDEVPALVERVLEAPQLRLRGVMAVAPLGADSRPAFERLAAVATRVRALHPDATWISAGMSGDLESAIAAGATHVRVGSAILGERQSVR